MNNSVNIQKTKLKSPIVLGTTAAFLLTSWVHFDASNPLHAEENEPFLGAVANDGIGTVLNVRKFDFDGNVTWKSSSNSSGTIMDPLDVDVDESGNLYTADQTGNIYKYDSESGEKEWEFSVNGMFPRNVAATDNGFVYASDSDGYIYQLDSDTGEETWSLDLERTQNITTNSQDDVYVATTNNSYKIDHDTGDILWEFSVSWENANLVLEAPNGIVYAGMSTGEIHVIDDDNGDILDTLEPEINNIRDFVVDSEGNFYYPSNNAVYRWNPTTDEVLWTYNEHSENVESLAIDHEGHIYSASNDEELHKIHGGTGENEWKYTDLESRWNGVAVGGIDALGGIGAAANPTSPTQQGSTSFAGGELSLTLGNDTFQFNDITLNEGRTTSTTSLAPVTISDQTGTGDGWKVQVEASPFTQVEPSGGFAEGTGDMTIGGEALTMSPEAIEGLDGASTTGVNITNESFSIIEEQQTVVSADAGRGIGDYLMTFSADALSLKVPSNTPLIDRANYPEGNTPYETTLQWNIVSGP